MVWKPIITYYMLYLYGLYSKSFIFIQIVTRYEGENLSDKTLGSLLFLLSLILGVAYVYWLFFPPLTGLDWLFYVSGENTRWAVVLPVLLGVALIAFIAMWIGWTMATTPPPTIIEEPTEEETKK